MKQLNTTVLILAAFLITSSIAYGGGGLKFKANLSGDQEVSPPAPPAGVATVTEGRVKASANNDFSEMRVDLDVFDGVAITQAHFHCGRPGQNGPVVVFLFGFVVGGVDVDGQLARVTLTNDDFFGADCSGIVIGRPVNNIVSLAFAMRDGLIYANVHSVGNPPGEIRGQMLEK